MRQRIIAALLASTFLLLSACSANIALDKNGNVSIDRIPAAELEDLEEYIGNDKAKPDSEDDTQVNDDIKNKILTDLPTEWDLTELYADEDAFETDMKRVEELIPEMGLYKGKLNSVEGILDYLENPKLLEIKALTGKADMYIGLLSLLDSTNPWYQKAAARFNGIEQEVSLAKAFVDPEIMNVPLEKRQEIFSDERLDPYAYFLRKYTDPDYVILSEEVNMAKTLMGDAVNNEDTYNIFNFVELPKQTFIYPDGTEAVLTDTE